MLKTKFYFTTLIILPLLFFLSAVSVQASLVGNTNQATLSLSPQSGTYKINDIIPVGIYLNTNNQPVVVVAAYLSYNPNHFQAISIDTNNSAFTMGAEADIKTPGIIKITRGIPSSSHVNSSNALVAIVNMKAIAAVSPSSDNFNFQFTAGSTQDSNVIKDDGLGTEILSGVYNARYTITGDTGDTQAPIVNTFTLPATASSLTVSITSLDATDNVAVTGYLLTESSTTPSLSASGWSATKPTSYTFSSAGTKTLYAWARDAAGNVSVSKSATVTVSGTDTIAPTITSVSASSVISNSATISWSTNEMADSQVEYGTSTSYGSQTTLNSTMTTSHYVSLSGLSPSTTYHYRVKSKDAAGNLATSGDYSFTTTSTAPPPSGNSLPIGFVDGADATHIFGWAYDKDAGSTPINVHIYIDDVPTANIVAQLSRPDLVTAKVTQEANHGFDYRFSPALPAGWHTIRVYAINSPEGPNPELPGSPVKIKIGSSATTTLVKLADDSRVYAIHAGKRRWLANPAVFAAGGYSWDDVQVVSADQLNQYPETRLIKATGDKKVYYITNRGLKKWIINEQVFASYSNRWEDVVEISPAELDAYVTNQLIHLDNDQRVYLITGATKQWIKTPAAFNKRHYNWHDIAPVNQIEFDAYTEGAAIE